MAVRDVIIVGSGPAGYTAAVYAARADLRPLVFEGSLTGGGALMNTTEVENYPGFADGIMGPELMNNMRQQAERFGADLRGEDVERVELDGEIKKVWVGGEEFQARTIILATGAAPRYLGVPGEDGRGRVRQGQLEASNVNVVEELVDMIETQRAYEVNSKMISATDDMLKYVNQNI